MPPTSSPARRRGGRSEALTVHTTVPLTTPARPKRRAANGRGVESRAGALGIIELPSRPTSDLTVQDYLCALQGLESGGTFRDAADLTRAAMTQWGFMRGILDTITAGTLGLPRQIVVAPGDERLKEALEGPQGVGGDLDVLEPRAEAKQVMAWGVTLGVGIGQMVRPDQDITIAPPQSTDPLPLQQAPDGSWAMPHIQRAAAAQRRATDNRCSSLLAWDPRWVRYQWWDRRIFLTTDKREIEIQPGDGEWVVYMPHGKSYPWRYAAWIFLALAFVMQRDAVFDRARHQQMVPPVRVGKVPEGSTQRQREEFLKQIREMQRFGIFVLPPGLEYVTVETSNAGQVDAIYEKVINWGREEAMFGLTGNRVIVEGNKGFSTGDIFERVTATLRAFYARSWEAAERGQILPWWTLDNYGPTVEVPAVVRQTDPPDDQDAKIARIGSFGEALTKLATGLGDVGAEVEFDSIREMAQQLGLKIKTKTGKSTTKPLQVTPSGVEKAVTAEELRADQGLPPFGDDRDDLTIPQLDAQAKADAEADAVAAGGTDAAPL